jgi:hypothetical protein
MAESLRTRLMRWAFNLYPAYRGTGGRITYIAADYHEIRMKLPLSWRTRNYVGTIFGGSIYGSTDPMFMIMLIKILGPDYVVWYKAATIRFRRPGRSTLEATFSIDPAVVSEIREVLKDAPKFEKVFTTELRDRGGEIHAVIEKTIHIAKRKPAEASS